MKRILLATLLSMIPVASVLADSTVSVTETVGNQPITLKPHTKDNAEGAPLTVKVGETVSISDGKYDIEFTDKTLKCPLKHFVLENDESYVVSVNMANGTCLISVNLAPSHPQPRNKT